MNYKICSVYLIGSFLQCIVQQVKGASVVEATLYSDVGQGGSSFLTKDYISDLTEYGFNGAAKSVCVTGIWFLYERDDFNDGGSGEYLQLMGDNVCQDLPEPLSANVLSLRQAGSPTDPNYSSLTLYSYSNFRGAEVYLTKDWKNLGFLRDQAYSAIVTGQDSWTVYTYDNYQGGETCLIPDLQTTVGGVTVNVGFFPTYSELGSSGSIRSVKKGCS